MPIKPAPTKSRTLRLDRAAADHAATLVAALVAIATMSVVAATGAWSVQHAREIASLTAP